MTEAKLPTSPEDFEANWVLASEAMRRASKHLHSSYTAVDTIFRRINSGDLFAVAKKVVVTAEGSQTARHYSPIPVSWWKQAQIGPTAGFGLSNDADFYLHSHQGSSSRGVTLLGVRFDPDGISDIVPLLKPPANLPAGTPPEAAPVDQRSRPALSTAEMRRFANLYVSLWGDQAREERARAAAIACYPDNNVPRDAFREYYREFRQLAGPITPGRPRDRGK